MVKDGSVLFAEISIRLRIIIIQPLKPMGIDQTMMIDQSLVVALLILLQIMST